MPTAIEPIDAQTRADIEALNIEYAWLLDHGHADRLDSLFTDDAVLQLPPGTFSGRAEIRAYAARRAALTARKARHVCANMRLERVAPDCIRGTVVHVLFRHDGDGLGDPDPMAVGDWEDVYRRDKDGRWRYAERRVVLVFESEAHR